MAISTYRWPGENQKWQLAGEMALIKMKAKAKCGVTAAAAAKRHRSMKMGGEMAAWLAKAAA
jgi:hypothetical protein